MPLLGALLVSLVGGLASFLGSLFAKRLAFYVAAAAAVSAAFAAMLGVINGLFSGLAVVAPVQLVVGSSWLIPENLDICISARVAAGVAVAIYRWHMNILLRAAS